MKRVVVTGVGVVAPGGVGREPFWKTLITGTSACNTATNIEHLELFRSHPVGGVFDWDPIAHGLSEEQVANCDRHIQFGLVAVAEAWADSGLDRAGLDAERVGVSAGTAIGSTPRLEQEYVTVSSNATEFNVNPQLATPYLYHAVSPATLSATVAANFGVRGPVDTVSSGCTAGIDAMAHAFEWIRDGEVEVALAGAAEAGICP